MLCGMPGVAFVPALLVSWSSAAFIISYAIAVLEGHVEPLVPYISDTGTKPPESGVFGFMINISALLVIVFASQVSMTKIDWTPGEKMQNYRPLVSLMDQYWSGEKYREENYADATGRATRKQIFQSCCTRVEVEEKKFSLLMMHEFQYHSVPKLLFLKAIIKNHEKVSSTMFEEQGCQEARRTVTKSHMHNRGGGKYKAKYEARRSYSRQAIEISSLNHIKDMIREGFPMPWKNGPNSATRNPTGIMKSAGSMESTEC
ncbi:hypothetical protein BTVI_118258 [Pitangus sulphuratus]|nr:hypothetical protein BTVI_118258 [Pitangus sulphuratus]